MWTYCIHAGTCVCINLTCFVLLCRPQGAFAFTVWSEKPEKRLLFRSSLLFYVSSVRERSEGVGGKQREVHKRVSDVFQSHLAPTLAPPPGRWWALLSVSVSLLSLETIQLMIWHGDCIAPLRWQAATQRATHTHKYYKCMHTHKRLCSLDCLLVHSLLNKIEH